MQDASLAFLKNLLLAPSPSGFEQPVQDVVRAWARPLADEVRTDRHGNVLAVLHPQGQPRIMLAGHCDQIALMVEHIDDNGFLYVQPIGGWDMQILLGQNLTVWTREGPVAGRPPARIRRRARAPTGIHCLEPPPRLFPQLALFRSFLIPTPSRRERPDAAVATAGSRPLRLSA